MYLNQSKLLSYLSRFLNVIKLYETQGTMFSVVPVFIIIKIKNCGKTFFTASHFSVISFNGQCGENGIFLRKGSWNFWEVRWTSRKFCHRQKDFTWKPYINHSQTSSKLDSVVVWHHIVLFDLNNTLVHWMYKEARLCAYTHNFPNPLIDILDLIGYQMMKRYETFKNIQIVQ